jgi:hypothetical protein
MIDAMNPTLEEQTLYYRRAAILGTLAVLAAGLLFSCDDQPRTMDEQRDIFGQSARDEYDRRGRAKAKKDMDEGY